MVTPQTTVISHSDLEKSDKWLINLFLSKTSNIPLTIYNLVKLEELVIERNESIDPQKYPEWMFSYVGLENIEANTGFLTSLEKKAGNKIKSRSKVFYGGDLLYGKLRPSLNKVYLVDSKFGAGICSTEIFVLKVKEDVISPKVLRFLLSTQYVLSQIIAYTAGAALPRIHISDFMNINIPIPDKQVLMALEIQLEEFKIELSKGRDLYFNFNKRNEQIFYSFFAENGRNLQHETYDGSSKFNGKLPF
jgi:restriction endonuclease S subunit